MAARIEEARLLCYESLHDIIEVCFDNDWESYFKGIKEYYRLKVEDESDLDYSDYFTLDYVIYAVHHELDYTVSMYIDENQIVEKWIVVNKISDEYKHYVWVSTKTIYVNYIK